MRLAILLKQLRESRNLTIRQLSEKTGVGNGTIGEIERGKNKSKINTLEKLSKGLELSKKEREKLFMCLLPEDTKTKNPSLPIILKQLREKKGMTIIELSQKAELEKGTVRDMETGKIKGSLKSLKQISIALDLSKEEKNILDSAFLERTSILDNSVLLKQDKTYSFEVEKDKAINLGLYLKEKRKILGYSTNHLEIKTNINKADISRLENGKKKKINPLYLKKLANALNLNQIELFNKAGFIDDIYLKEVKTSFDERSFKVPGEIIKEYRKKNKMTTLELAKKLEVSQVFITLLENGKRKINEKVIKKLDTLMSKKEIEKLIASEEYYKTPEIIKKKLIDLEKENEKLKLNNDFRVKILKGKEKLQYENLLNQNALFFNDKSISEEDKKKIVDALTEAFYAIKRSKKRTK